MNRIYKSSVTIHFEYGGIHIRKNQHTRLHLHMILAIVGGGLSAMPLGDMPSVSA